MGDKRPSGSDDDTFWLKTSASTCCPKAQASALRLMSKGTPDPTLPSSLAPPPRTSTPGAPRAPALLPPLLLLSPGVHVHTFPHHQCLSRSYPPSGLRANTTSAGRAPSASVGGAAPWASAGVRPSWAALQTSLLVPKGSYRRRACCVDLCLPLGCEVLGGQRGVLPEPPLLCNSRYLVSICCVAAGLARPRGPVGLTEDVEEAGDRSLRSRPQPTQARAGQTDLHTWVGPVGSSAWVARSKVRSTVFLPRLATRRPRDLRLHGSTSLAWVCLSVKWYLPLWGWWKRGKKILVITIYLTRTVTYPI